jgi:hypothetical protein
VRDKVALWRLYNVATAYGNRPSDHFPHLETDLAKWTLDEACLLTGRTYESALQEGKDPFKGAANAPKEKFAPAPKRKIRKVKSLAEIGVR